MARKSRSFADMETKNLTCRTLGHAWEHEITFVVKQGLFELHFKCLRCPTTRIDDWTSRGLIDGRAYRYPDGYQIEGLSSWGGRKTFNQNVRAELVTRLSKGAKKREA